MIAAIQMPDGLVIYETYSLARAKEFTLFAYCLNPDNFIKDFDVDTHVKEIPANDIDNIPFVRKLKDWRHND